jgi:coenzyme F420-reducing hydrogenase beta subunit
MVLAKSKPVVSRQILQSAPTGLINALSEIALNVLHGGIPLSTAQKKKMGRFKRQLRDLSKKRTAVKRKRTILQSGGFISGLLTAALPVILQGASAIVQNIVRNRKRRT